jgi:hypothetical protein
VTLEVHGKKPKKEKQHGRKATELVPTPVAATTVETSPVEQPQIAATVPLAEPAVTAVDDGHDNGHGHAYGREKHGDK